jgi:predicted ribosome quality control (RQC) complex YloA/Tae2 family protein
VRKKEFTSFDVAIAVHELKEAVANARVNNIYQLNEKTLVLKLHKTSKPPLRLVMEAGTRLHLTSYALKPPKVPPAFCMALRKYLRGAWVDSVEQYEFERIAIVHFRTKTGAMRLILELFGEGNIILTNEKNEILQALVFKRMRDRNIVRNEAYQFPPPIGKNPFKVSRGALQETLKELGDVEVVRALARLLGVGGFYAEEILLRADVEKNKQCSALSNAEVDAVFDALQSLLSDVSAFKTEPHIVLAEDGSFLDAVPFKLKRYEGMRSKLYRSFNEALDEFYLRATAAERAVASGEVDKLTREAERLKRIIAEQEKALRDDEAKAERDKCIGDVIYAHTVEFQAFLDKFAAAKREGRDWKALISEITAAKKDAFLESFDQRNLLANVCVSASTCAERCLRTLLSITSAGRRLNKKPRAR